MLAISQNPLLSIGHGCVTLTGTCSALGFSLLWWYEDTPGTTFSRGVTISGSFWSIDLVLTSAVDKVCVRASLLSEYSNVLTINLATNHEQPVPTYQANEFDSMGFEADIQRYSGETNTNLRERALSVWTHPGSSTRIGLINGIERELLLKRLDPFFFLSVRFDPRTNKAYDESVRVFFDLHDVSVQLAKWVVYNEFIDIDPLTGAFTTTRLVGSEDVSVDNVVQIWNGAQLLDRRFFTQVSENSFVIDINKIDPTKALSITYPYRKRLEYIQNGEEITVLHIKEFLQAAETVVDENGYTVPLITWNDGYLENVAEVPLGYTAATFSSYERLVDSVSAVNSTYFTVTGNKTSRYYRYVNDYKAKGFFQAGMIIPQLMVRLTTTPRAFRGSYVKIGQLFDKKLQRKLHTRNQGTGFKNLRFYANTLRNLCRVGIDKAIVDADEWGSDSPTIIGDNFIPSEFDGGKQPFPIISASGSVYVMSLNERKAKIKLLANMS